MTCGLFGLLTSAALFLLPSSIDRLALALLFCVPPALGLTGLVTGIVAMRRLPRRIGVLPGRTAAITGIITSALTVLGWAVVWLAVAIFVYGLSHSSFTY